VKPSVEKTWTTMSQSDIVLNSTCHIFVSFFCKPNMSHRVLVDILAPPRKFPLLSCSVSGTLKSENIHSVLLRATSPTLG